MADDENAGWRNAPGWIYGGCWHSGSRHYGGEALPTKAQIQTEVDRIRTSETARDNRMGEYPELAEQFDKLYHDIDSGTVDKTGSFYTALKAIKDKYPKG